MGKMHGPQYEKDEQIIMIASSTLAFDLGIAAAAISPGPAFVLTAQTALRTGKSAGLLVALGVVVAASLWLNASFFGLSAILAVFPQTHFILKIAGGAYLVYLGVMMWRHAHEQLDITSAPKAKNSFFLRGWLINITNPKAFVFTSAIVFATVPHNTTVTHWAFLLGNHFAIEMGWLAFCVFLLSTRKARELYLARKIYFDRACAIMLALLGLSMAI